MTRRGPGQALSLERAPGGRGPGVRAFPAGCANGRKKFRRASRRGSEVGSRWCERAAKASEGVLLARTDWGGAGGPASIRDIREAAAPAASIAVCNRMVLRGNLVPDRSNAAPIFRGLRPQGRLVTPVFAK